MHNVIRTVFGWRRDRGSGLFSSVLLRESRDGALTRSNCHLHYDRTLSKRIVAWLRGERERGEKYREILKRETRPRHFSLASFFLRRSCDFPFQSLSSPLVSSSIPLLAEVHRFNQLPDAERISRTIASKTRPVSTDMRSPSYRRLSFVALLLFPSTINIFLAE